MRIYRIAKVVPQWQKIGGDVILYRGLSAYNKNGNYYTPVKEWARQFTQSGQDKEVITVKIPEGSIYIAEELPKAYDENSFDNGLKEAKENGFKAFVLDEGNGEPQSVYVIDKSIVKRI
jgi:hypothetical protein